ncbi:MAG: PAS domain-containing protein [Fimbriimonadaceae bacterium]|nr:MAG: PAS domain-containing protein [Fimbriimonadaceae bacterium]
MDWLKFAPVFGGLAILAGAVGLVVPEAKSLALVAIALFGFAGLVGWIQTARELGASRDELGGLERERHQLEGEVARHRDALDDLADGLDSLIFLLDRDQRILYANRQAQQLLRLNQPKGENLKAATLSSELSELVESVKSSGDAVSHEITLRHPTERVFQARVWHEGYGHERVFLSLHDVTDLRRLETVRRDFVANVSHELRTPMTTIRAMAETLEESADDAELESRYLGKIIREVDRLTRITDDLLTLSIAEGGTVSKTECDFDEVAASVVTQLESKAREKGLKLSFKKEGEYVVQANETQLTQIVFNLVDNALNYTAEGSVSVSMSSDQDEAVLTIADTGIGIASEHLPRIFERFYRVDKGRSRASGGTGLGLAIVRHLAELHGGSVSVQSELNRGTTFTVRIPLATTDNP